MTMTLETFKTLLAEKDVTWHLNERGAFRDKDNHCPIMSVYSHNDPKFNRQAGKIGHRMGLSDLNIKAIIIAADHREVGVGLSNVQLLHSDGSNLGRPVIYAGGIAKTIHKLRKFFESLVHETEVVEPEPQTQPEPELELSCT